MQQPKNSKGQLSRKRNVERKVRSIRLTDETWNTIGEKASQYQMNKSDFLEALAKNQLDWE